MPSPRHRLAYAGVIPLMLNVISAVAFGHVMKWSTIRKANLLWVAACNYLGASIACSLALLVARPSGHIWFTAFTGAWGGVSYLISLLYYFAAVKALGMGLATSVNRIAIALPVAAALLIWHETLHIEQAVGLALVAISLPLLGSGKYRGAQGGTRLLLGLLLPLFVVTGVGQVANRIYNSGAPSNNVYLFLACLFGAAGISALIALRIRPVPLKRQDLFLGLLLGSINTITNLLLLAALRELPSAVVFSVSSAASVLLAAITGVMFWGDRMNKVAAGGVLMATLAVVLLTH
ncbi:MAG: integral rane protein [Chloroflexi bacterium]|nr:integral rane protein [Chloroflexota bacterium]